MPFLSPLSGCGVKKVSVVNMKAERFDKNVKCLCCLFMIRISFDFGKTLIELF